MTILIVLSSPYPHKIASEVTDGEPCGIATGDGTFTGCFKYHRETGKEYLQLYGAKSMDYVKMEGIRSTLLEEQQDLSCKNIKCCFRVGESSVLFYPA